MNRAKPRTLRITIIGSAALLCCVAAVVVGVELYIAEEPNYTGIDDGLYMGGHVSRPPRRTRAVLNLCESADPYQAGVHRWEPIRDAEPAPDLEWLQRMVGFVDTQRKAGNVVYIHCLNGVSRSGLVVVAYLMAKYDWKRDQALEFVRSKRPIVRPHPAFMRLLLEWEKHLNRG